MIRITTGSKAHRVTLSGTDRPTVVELTALIRAIQHVDPAEVFESHYDRAAFERVNRKLVRAWGEVRRAREASNDPTT